MLALYVGSVVFVGFQFGGRAVANNLKIFRWSFFHLVGQQDIYAPYPDQYYDLFKYSPSWAMLFAPFALPPMAIGFFLWDLCAALLLYQSVQRLLPERQARLALAIAYLPFAAAMQHASNTNTVVVGLIILAFAALERGRHVEAGAAIATGALMKIYPLAALTFGLFYSRKGRLAGAFAASLAALVALPLLVTPPAELLAQWRSWGRVLQRDTLDQGYTVMHLVTLWTGVVWPNWPQQLGGAALMLLPLALRRHQWGDAHFRRLFLCSVLLYVLIFNHEAETPSFVVGFTGIAIWYAMSRHTPLRNALMAFAFVCVPLLHSELVPWSVRQRTLAPQVMIYPCVVLWLVLQVELFVWRGGPPASPPGGG